MKKKEDAITLTGQQAKIGAFVCNIASEVFRLSFLHHGDKSAALDLSHAEHIKRRLEANPDGATLNQYETATLAGYTEAFVQTFAFIVNGLTGKEPNSHSLADAWDNMSTLDGELQAAVGILEDEEGETA